MEQIGGNVLPDPTTDQFNRARERFPLPVIPNDMEVTGTGSGLKIKAIVPEIISNRIQFKIGFADISTHRSIPSCVHH